MLLHAVSLGREVDLRRPRAGTVHSVFDRAVNLLVAGELWTVSDAGPPGGPYGLQLSAGGLAVLRDLRAGDPVKVRAGHAGLGRHVIDGRTAARWAPARWPAPSAGLAARLAAVALAARARAWPGSGALADGLVQALGPTGAEGERRLAEAVRQTVGRGPGLTPAGDDVIVGILAVLATDAAGPAGASACARLSEALVPLLPTTTDVSRHLIGQAARGLPGRALHDLGHALVAGATEACLQRALATVLATGATSGADACLGLVAAGRAFLPIPERLAA